MHAWGAGERGKSDQWQRIQEHYANRNDGTSGSGLRRRRRRRGETGSGQHCLRLVLSFIEKASLVVQHGVGREWR